jgi:hypothetical protein
MEIICWYSGNIILMFKVGKIFKVCQMGLTVVTHFLVNIKGFTGDHKSWMLFCAVGMHLVQDFTESLSFLK